MIKELYGQGTVFMKSPLYEMLSVPPLGVFAMRNRYDHRQRRRLLSHAFSQSNLLESEPLILAQVNSVLQILGNMRDQNLNVADFFRRFSLDVVGTELRLN